ncbi:hypothetical protein GCM10007103_25640 [Salinimicrobium marinum]|uniref:Uncharacterized protein n=1 Tax=Salinimicrobium marinum TaxID=680283 RepID=A0A918SHW7_9FLAO|nr:hypothetical protein [Salinimicrobium marinum]GHA43235.1 hypothetical protein GCM10007103_25640 [Salinimicrobium marinum]
MRSTKFIVLAAFAFIVMTSCRDTEKETVIKEVHVEKETQTETEEREGILERSAKKVDAEVNKEVNEEIEKIGDDN